MRSIMLVITVSLALGCGEKQEKSGAAKETKDKPAAKSEWKSLGSLGLEASVPGSTEIDDKTKSAGFPTATIWASPTTFVTGKNDMFWPADVAKAKAEIQKDPNKFQAFSKEESKDGGFHLEYTLESMMDKKPIYGVKLRRTIGGKVYDCGSNSSSEAERAKVIALCGSLRAASGAAPKPTPAPAAK